MTSSKDSSRSAWACVCRVSARAAATSSDGAALARSKRSTVAFFSFTSIRSDETCDSNVCTLADRSAFASLVYLAPSSTFASAASNSLILPLNSASVAANFSLSSIRTFLIARASKCAFCLSSSMASSPASALRFPASSPLEFRLQRLDLRRHLRPRRRRSLSNLLFLPAHRIELTAHLFVFIRHPPHLPVQRRLRSLQRIRVFPRLAQRLARVAVVPDPSLTTHRHPRSPPRTPVAPSTRALVVSTALETFDLAALASADFIFFAPSKSPARAPTRARSRLRAAPRRAVVPFPRLVVARDRADRAPRAAVRRRARANPVDTRPARGSHFKPASDFDDAPARAAASPWTPRGVFKMHKRTIANAGGRARGRAGRGKTRRRATRNGR